MNIPEIAKCPNPECGAAMGRLISLQGAWLECSACGYSSPKSDSVEKAIHLHNAICRQPTPEAADNEPDFNLWTRIAFYAIKAAEKQNGVRLIPMGDEDAEAFMESIDCALQESLDEILETDSDEPAHPPKPEPTEARELNLKWGRHDGRGEYHIEWHAPCGCAYHPEPKPHVHPCIKHSQIEDALHDLREMWLNFPGLSFGSLSIPCIQEMSPEQADFYEKACEIAKASPAAVSGDKQEKERG